MSWQPSWGRIGAELIGIIVVICVRFSEKATCREENPKKLLHHADQIEKPKRSCPDRILQAMNKESTGIPTK